MVGPPPLPPKRSTLVIPGCRLRKLTPDLTSRAIVSHFTRASLLSNRGFMQRTMNPLRDNSVHGKEDRTFEVRCVTSTPTCGAGPESGLYSAPFTAPPK